MNFIGYDDDPVLQRKQINYLLPNLRLYLILLYEIIDSKFISKGTKTMEQQLFHV
jgi:hypothetical protein